MSLRYHQHFTVYAVTAVLLYNSPNSLVHPSIANMDLVVVSEIHRSLEEAKKSLLFARKRLENANVCVVTLYTV